MKKNTVRCLTALVAVLLCSAAQAATTRTWRDNASGLWTTKANWTANAYPNGNSHIASFPATMVEGVAVTNTASITLQNSVFANVNAMSLVLDNGQIANNKSSSDKFSIGVTGPATVEFRGETPQLSTAQGYGNGRVEFGEAYTTVVRFVLPRTPWTSTTAPIKTTGDDTVIVFLEHSEFEVDASNIEIGVGQTNVYVLAEGKKGVRTDNSGGASFDSIFGNARVTVPADCTYSFACNDRKNLTFTLMGPAPVEHDADTHVMGAWAETVAPRVGVAGQKTRHCTEKYCLHVENSEVPAIPAAISVPTGFAAENTILCFGDSLTYGTGADEITMPATANYFDGRMNGKADRESYPYQLAKLVPSDYNVIGQAKAGKTTDAIVSWMGGIPVKTSYAFTLPAGANVEVAIPTNILYNGTDGGTQYENYKANPERNATPYYGLLTPSWPLLEPATVNDTITGWLGGIHVRLGGNHCDERTICRTDAGTEAVEIPVGSTFIPDAALTYADAIKIIYAGTNDGNANSAKYIQTIQDAITRTGTERYIVISSHSMVKGGESLTQTSPTAIESQFQAAFGQNYLNLRLAFVNDEGFAGFRPNGDDTHYNSAGYAKVAAYVKARLVFLGYVPGEGPVDPTIYGSPDTSAITYTWKDTVSGPWNYTTNWTPSVTPCYGFPNQGSYAAVVFPATLAGDNVVTANTSVSVKKIDFQNENKLKLVVEDGTTITIPSGNDRAFRPGNTGPAELVFRGTAQIDAKAGGSDGRLFFGENDDTLVCFELPSTARTTTTAPLRASGHDAPIKFGQHTRFRVDASNLTRPGVGAAVTNVLAWNDDGIRFDSGMSDTTLAALEVVNCPAGATGGLEVVDKSLCFILRGPTLYPETEPELFSYLRIGTQGTSKVSDRNKDGYRFETDYVPNFETTRIRMRMKFNNVSNQSSGLFAASHLTAGHDAAVNGTLSANYFYDKVDVGSARTPWLAYERGTGNSISETDFRDDQQFQNFVFDPIAMKRNGLVFGLTLPTPPTGLADGPLVIGAMTSGKKTYYNYIKMDLAYFKVDELQPNGTYKPVHWWYPATNSVGDVCLYDRVGKKFLMPVKAVNGTISIAGAEKVMPAAPGNGFMLLLK